MKKFAIIGVAGYIAERHLKAIYNTSNKLVASVDLTDSVGILDRYFPYSKFFNNFNTFISYIKQCNSKKTSYIDYIVICTPNYLHFEHIKVALELGSNVICEKPLVLTEKDLKKLEYLEKLYNKKVYTVMQLRLHNTIIDLKNMVSKDILMNRNKKYTINLKYITCRGNWYFSSWKGDIKKSGGLATNIGIHFFDMLIYIFGNVIKFSVDVNKKDVISGILELEYATVNWILSISCKYLPFKTEKMVSYREIILDDQKIDFSSGFEDLHTKLYINILNNNGYGLNDVYNVIKLLENINKNL